MTKEKLYENYPCKECRKNDQCQKICEKWRIWFGEAWEKAVMPFRR